MKQELPQGILTIHAEGKGIINPKQTKTRSVAEVTRGLNQADNLQRTFYDSQNPRVLHSIDFADGSQVRLYNQTGKYSETSLLVIANGPHTFTRDKEGPIPTETIYDYPSAVQEAYWQQTLTSMDAFTDNAPVKNMRVFAGENCIATYSNEQHRTSRSIANPHIHVVGFIEEHVKRETIVEKVPNLSYEQSVLEKLVPKMVTEISETLPTDIQNITSLQPRTELPVGYSFSISGELKEFASEPKEFSRIMEEHHNAYTNFTQKNADLPKDISIPQPSYRMYLEHNQGKLHVTISPELVSHAGVMEAAGIILDRSSEHPTRLPEEKIVFLQKTAAIEAQSLQ